MLPPQELAAAALHAHLVASVERCVASTAALAAAATHEAVASDAAYAHDVAGPTAFAPNVGSAAELQEQADPAEDMNSEADACGICLTRAADVQLQSCHHMACGA
jgi:hypothetical protein